jgi:RES domain-containing protein
MLDPLRSLILWRAYVPRWAHAPMSGEGAAVFGGRWNAVGQPCLYAACELSTAWAEYNQGFVQHPATIVQLQLEGARLVDLTSAQALVRLGQPPDIHRTQWRADMDEGRMPRTHRLSAALQKEGYDGVRYPSFMSPGGTCVALWRWNEEDGPVLSVSDPEKRLPKDPASWL